MNLKKRNKKTLGGHPSLVIFDECESLHPSVMQQFLARKPDDHFFCEECAEIGSKEVIDRKGVWNIHNFHLCRTCKDRENGIFKINGQTFKIDALAMTTKNFGTIIHRFDSFRIGAEKYISDMSVDYLPFSRGSHFYILYLRRRYLYNNLYEFVPCVAEIMQDIINKIDNHIEITKEERDFYCKMIPKVRKILL